MIDNRSGHFPQQNHELIAKICDRRFGVGADGLIVLQHHKAVDFAMLYYNADGQLGSFCGNGGRCIVAFAKQLGLIDEKTVFAAYDGVHHATIADDIVSLSMADVNRISVHTAHVFLDTGSPHHVTFVRDTNDLDVHTKGAQIAHDKRYGTEGSNVNFVHVDGDHRLRMRTYERGVEAETLSCGTGVTAAVLAAFSVQKIKTNEVEVHTLGGQLTVSFQQQGEGFTEIVLTGPTAFVFSGTLSY